MQYLGGKSRIAKRIAAAIVSDTDRRVFWDPFCGGLAMGAALGEHGEVFASDTFAPLISLYRAVKAGWDPPADLSEAEYQAARDLPDSNPLKAFAGFGCSFGGKWFGGYARSGPERNHADESRRSLLRQVPQVAHFARADFLAVPARPAPHLAIYCDPPYADTTGYEGTEPFDRAAFWARVREWEGVGVPVYVSEFTAPDLPHRVIWAHGRKRAVDSRRDRPVVRELLIRLGRP